MTEPALCTYRFTVCVPQLCDNHHDGAAGDKDSDSDSSTPSHSGVEASVTSTRSDDRPAAGHGRPGSSKSPENDGANSFYGLLWGAVLVTDDQPMWWVDSVEPMTALSH